MMIPYVLPLDSPHATLAAVGGKGANLSRMARAGFPVPSGFLITTGAYRTFVQANNLHAHIAALASDTTKTVPQVSGAIRALFEQGHMPPDIVARIALAYADLVQASAESPPVAVRSSATAEDLADASFAGQHASYLNVRGKQAVLDAVKQCWSSLWTARALDYRARQHIDAAGLSLAVVVQTMVEAEASGILFTANSLSGSRDEMVLDAAWGLGEGIVGGLITPDHVVADKATGAIKQMLIGDKAARTIPTATGTAEREVEASRRDAHVLDAAQVVELVKLGAAIEAHFGVPQDIEWCLADRTFWMVQTRPITTLPAVPVRWDSPVQGAKWVKDLQAGEWTNEPLSPLGATTTFAAMVAARQLQLPMQQLPWSTLVNGWLYSRADFRVGPLVLHLLGMLPRLPVWAHDGHARVQRSWPPQLTTLAALEQIDLPSLSTVGLRSHAEHLLTVLGWWWWELTWYTAVTLATEQVLGKLCILALANPAALFRGNDSHLVAAERALRQAADTGEVEGYLAQFGHFTESADPIHPTLREAPALLAQYLAVVRQSTTGPDERLQRMREQRAAAEQIIWAQRGLRGGLARRLVWIGQSYAAHVDDAVFHFQRVLARLRASLLEAGARLERAHVLPRRADVFFLTWSEVWEVPPDMQERVSTRRTLREHQKQLVPPPLIPPLSAPAWRTDRMWQLFSAALGTTVLERGARMVHGQAVVVGTPGSPGRARGPARVISGPRDFHRVQPGDVLVAHATTPIWTPLFNIARAVVTEVGGPFSHAAIVAREFGIPLVTGALEATRSIEDGTVVVVDGSAGIAELTARWAVDRTLDQQTAASSREPRGDARKADR